MLRSMSNRLWSSRLPWKRLGALDNRIVCNDGTRDPALAHCLTTFAEAQHQEPLSTDGSIHNPLEKGLGPSITPQRALTLAKVATSPRRPFSNVFDGMSQLQFPM